MKKTLVFLLLSALCTLAYSQYSEKAKKAIEKGIAYQTEGNFKKAIQQFDKLILEHNDIWQAYATRGHCYSMLLETQKALPDFLKAYELDSSQYLLLNNIGMSYAVLQQHKKAIEYYKKALDKEVEFTYSDYFNLGSAYYFLAEMDSAIRYLEVSREMDSVNSLAGDNLAWAYLDRDPVKSCFFFNEAYLKDSLDSRVINNLGYSHLLCGNLEEAFQFFMKAEKLDKQNSFIYRNFGLYYMKKGEKKEACKNLQKALNLKIVEEWGTSYITELQTYCMED